VLFQIDFAKDEVMCLSKSPHHRSLSHLSLYGMVHLLSPRNYKNDGTTLQWLSFDSSELGINSIF
jgi:hypothetical protein